jgi:copper oxidase (laccase) domain-containing protein
MASDVVLIKERGHYRVPLFEEMGYRAFFTTRPHDMSFDHGRRKAAYRGLKIDPRAIACPDQVHGDKVVVVTKRHS